MTRRFTARNILICPSDRITEESPDNYNGLPEETKRLLKAWIGWTLKPSKKIFDHTSYGLKHEFEYDTGIYTTNGQFKGAMLAAEFKTPEPEALNWEFYASYTVMGKQWKKEHYNQTRERMRWLDMHYANPVQVEVKGPCVYFLQAGEAGLIKIGTAINLNKRVLQLQTGCPQELRILGTIEGDSELETKLHKEFNEYRFRSEWFNPDPEIIDYIFKNAILYGFRDNLQIALREAAILEKRILPILAEAAKQQNTEGYNRIRTYYSLKNELVPLVGWESSNPKLQTQHHYDAVILFMSDLLPSDNIDLNSD